MPTLEKLRLSIKQYLEEKGTDYAIMINGVWGSGKTHFIRSRLFPELEKSNSDLKLIYLSLFGVTGTSDLHLKIVLEIYPFLNTKIAKTIGTLGKVALSRLGFSGIDKAGQINLLDTIGKVDANTLIVFDDLERLDSNLLVEILGFINQLVEHNNTKVIVLANEGEIIESVDKGPVDYRRYSEKVVRHKLRFELDFEEVGAEIVGSAGVDARHTRDILDAFKRGECSNLRTLRFVCSMSRRILQSLNKVDLVDDQMRRHVEHIVLYFLASIAIELKSNRMAYVDLKKLVSWSMDRPFDFSEIDFSKVEMIDKGDRKIIKNEDSQSQQEYFARYFSPNQMMYFDSLVEFLESGLWDEDRFLTEIKAVINYFITKGMSEAQQFLQKLLNIAQADDDKVTVIVEGVLRYVQAGSYSIDKYLQIYFIIRGLIEENIVNYSASKLYKDILKGIVSCKDTQYTPYLEDRIRISSDENERVKSIHKKTIKRNQEIKTEAFLELSREHLDAFFDDPEGYSRNYLSKKDVTVPGFHFSCPTQEFLNRYDKEPNRVKVELNRVFHQRQMDRTKRDKPELEWMRALKRELDKATKIKPPSIATLNKRELSYVLQKVIDNWEKFEERLDT